MSYPAYPAGMSFPAAITRAGALSLHPPPETPKRHSLAISVSDISEVVDGSGRFLGDAAREKLINAAKDGDEAVVKKLIEAGTNVDAAEISGKTALQAAAENGHEGMVRILLNAGAALVTPAAEYSGRTALQAAAEGGHEGVVRMLLSVGARADAPPTGTSGRTALQAAAGRGHKGVIRILLEAGANVNAPPSRSSGRTALQAAAESGHEDVIQILLKADADIETPPSEFHGRTALQAAAGAGHENVVEVLLEAGANIDAGPSEFAGRTALQAAAGGGWERVVSMLLVNNANVNALPSNSSGRTALQAAAEAGHEDVVKRLIEAGASTDAPASECSGKTALQAAAGGGHEGVVKILLEAEATTGASKSESYGAEALEAAVIAGYEKVVRILLDGGVNINTRNSLGRTCLFSPNMNSEMLQELLRLGAYIDHQDYDGLTPLHYAADIGCKELLICLLEAGADMGVEDNRTRRPLHLALEKKHEDLVRLLLEKGDNIRDSRVKNWRAVLGASEDDIIMISENASGGNAIKKVDINNVEIGVESEALLPMKHFYSAYGRKWNDKMCLQLVNPWEFMSKYIVIESEDHPKQTQADVQWMWALVNPKKDQRVRSRNFGPGIPNIGNIATTAHTKAFLICYVAFDFYVYIPPNADDLQSGEYCFRAGTQRSQISWVMRKTESAGMSSGQIFRSMNYRSTLEYGYVPKHGVDFFTLFIKDLRTKWEEVFLRAENHLKESRKNLLLKEGGTTSLIRTLLRDAQQWSDFRSLHKLHIKQAKDLVKEFREKRLLHDEVNDLEEKGPEPEPEPELEPELEPVKGGESENEGLTADDSEGEKKKRKKGKKGKKEKKAGKLRKETIREVKTELDNLEDMIASLKEYCKNSIKKLDKKTEDMIELEFNLVSISEARISTSTAQSMKRLTWITFVFLPLLFVASLFGMNLDVLNSGTVKWWWYAVLSISVFIMVLSGWAMFKYASDVEKWCEDICMGFVEKLPPLRIPFIQRRKKISEDEENGKKKNS